MPNLQFEKYDYFASFSQPTNYSQTYIPGWSEREKIFWVSLLNNLFILYLTIVTNTSQISSSGNDMVGGRLEKKSLLIGKMMNLRKWALDLSLHVVLLPDWIWNRTFNSDLVYFFHLLYPITRQLFTKLFQIFIFNLMGPNSIKPFSYQIPKLDTLISLWKITQKCYNSLGIL